MYIANIRGGGGLNLAGVFLEDAVLPNLCYCGISGDVVDGVALPEPGPEVVGEVHSRHLDIMQNIEKPDIHGRLLERTIIFQIFFKRKSHRLALV